MSQRLKSGTSKADIYHELANGTDDETLRRALASKPPRKLRRADRILNNAVCWSWVLIVLMEILGDFDTSSWFNPKTILSLAGSFFLLFQLWRFNGDAYLAGMVWLALGVYNTAKDVYWLSPDEPDRGFIVLFSWGYVGFLLLTIALMYTVRKRVFGYYR